MPRHLRTRLALLGCCLFAACSPSPSRQQQTLEYRFADGGRYRVEAEYTLERKLEKSHQKRVFSREASRLDIRASFLLQVSLGPKPGLRLVEYTLLNLRSHDPQGKFRAELGRESGELSWYGEARSLEEYLGPEGWDRYLLLVRQPLARLVIQPQGVEVTGTEQGSGFNQELVKLLLTNRVLGERLARSLKIPPVLAALLPPAPVSVGETWTLDNPERPGVSDREWSKGTSFTLASENRGELELKLKNRLDFSGDDLNALGSLVGLKYLENTRFQGGQFLIDGRVRFLSRPGRPKNGSMRVEKQYGLINAGEDWSLHETEVYEFSLTPNP